MLLSKIIYMIKEELNINSDDKAFEYQDDFIADKINITRNFLIKQRYGDARKMLPRDLYQQLCITLTVVDEDSDVCLGTVLKSTSALPDLLDVGGIYRVFAGKQENRFVTNINMIDPERFAFTGYNDLLINQIYATIAHDNYFYMKSDTSFYKLIKNVQLYAVLENPTSTNFVCANSSNTDCDKYEHEYPITEDLLSDLVKLVKQDLMTKIQIPTDQVNDANGTLTQGKE